MKPPIPSNESARLEALRRYKILDTAPERELDDITQLASFICGTPIAIMSLVDADRQWFKARVGIKSPQGTRDDAFCAHTIMGPGTLIVQDAFQDERFALNPLVTGDPNIRFYAGAPLVTSEGMALGSLCVIDREPRILTDAQISALEALARLVMMKLDLRNVTAELATAAASLKTLNGLLPICAYCKSIRDDEGYWSRVESYVEDNTDAIFTHGICPACTQKHFPDFAV